MKMSVIVNKYVLYSILCELLSDRYVSANPCHHDVQSYLPF